MLEPGENNRIWKTVADDQLTHLHEVTNFLQSEFGPAEGPPMWTSDLMRWKLGPTNPAGCGFLSYAVVDGRVVGSATLTRKRALLNGQEIACGEVGDTYTAAFMRRTGTPVELSAINSDPGHFINKSIFGRLVSDVFARACSQGIQLVYGTPNQNSYPGYTKKLGYTELLLNPIHCFSRPTSYLIGQRFPKLKLISCLLKFAEQPFLNITCMLLKLLNPGLSMSQVQPDDDAINALWDATKPDTGFSLIRDAAYWRYRYDENPLAKYDKFYFSKDGCLAGLVVCKKTGSPNSKQVFSLVEWMSLDKAAIGMMIACAIQKGFAMHKPGVINLWARDDQMLVRQLNYQLFLKRAKVPVIFAPTPLAPQMERLNDFCFAIGSSDAM